MTRLQSATESATHRTDRLRSLMTQAGISSFRELSRRAAVSQWQVRQVRTGPLSNLRWGVLCQLSQALNLSPSQFIAALEREPNPAAAQPSYPDQERESLKQEYQRLQVQLSQQSQQLRQEFQRESLERLESFLRFWYTAAAMVQQNPQLPAKNLLPLIRPLEQLFEDWGLIPIGDVQAIVPYNPQQHQLKQGTANPGDRVRITHRGYYHGDRLLWRAQVDPLPNPPHPGQP
ncbi:XRE family transcriptional regulator [Geitlerinema sp. P-1104]|uniref:helix-turn-helix domain-containing protein n=1 Tax=Geitlerinema sp. P-1104 TaxID=2546230 RepID=UPI001476CDB9|nr:helix-turn-helix transcriptional regulator [Geitlerinema sp. P-1104]NMG57284.1 XRE family transcriptional regulator [Geitlerinema sp. P-1104]